MVANEIKLEFEYKYIYIYAFSSYFITYTSTQNIRYKIMSSIFNFHRKKTIFSNVGIPV